MLADLSNKTTIECLTLFKWKFSEFPSAAARPRQKIDELAEDLKRQTPMIQRTTVDVKVTFSTHDSCWDRYGQSRKDFFPDRNFRGHFEGVHPLTNLGFKQKH